MIQVGVWCSMARPTKYNEERAAQIEQAIGVGATRKLACLYAGIDIGTLENWEKRYSVFSERLKKAEGRASIGWLAKIEKAANEEWQAAAWKLERRYPQDYGRKVTEVTGAGGKELLPLDLVRKWIADAETT